MPWYQKDCQHCHGQLIRQAQTFNGQASDYTCLLCQRCSQIVFQDIPNALLPWFMQAIDEVPQPIVVTS